jgi:hypothetical protein
MRKKLLVSLLVGVLLVFSFEGKLGARCVD